MNRYIALAAGIAAIASLQTPAYASVARMSTPANHQLISTSRNDKWGVGYIGDGSTGDTSGFLWNLVTGKIDNVGTLSDAGGIAVDNNGVVYGCYSSNDVTGASRIAPGYYKDGNWHNLPIPEGFSGSGLDACCSSDGRFVAMTLDDPQGFLTPVVWRDGVPFVVKTNGSYCRVSCITEDGSMIGGWMNTDNRHNTIWTFDGSGYNEYMHPGNTPKWTDNVMGFSADNRYALVDDGWDRTSSTESEFRYFGLYDIQEKEMLPIFTPDNKGSDIYMFNMSGDRHAIGSYSGTAMIVTPDRKGHLLSDWLLENHGVDVHDFSEIITYENVFRLERGMTVNDGASRIGFIYYGDNDEGIDDYYPFYSMYLVLDADPDDATPVDLTAAKMPGIAAVALEWGLPFTCGRTVTGYEIYRDGVKVNADPVTDKIFYDSDVPAGSHTYAVRTLFEGGQSELSETLDFEMEEAISANPPQLLIGRQRGFNRVDLDWEAPKFNSGYLAYFNPDSNTDGMGTARNEITMEVGIKFPAAQMNLYKNSTLKSVSFTPMSDCDSWKICIYMPTASGTPREVYSQVVTQNIHIGEPNVIDLTTPYQIKGNDLIIAVQAYSKQANVRLFGYQQGNAKPGYSDLIRMYDGSGNPFDAFYDISKQAYGSPIAVCWKISGNFVPEGTGDDIDIINSYTVLEDGKELATTKDTEILLDNIADGEHTYAVRANYATGSASKDTEIRLNIDTKAKAKAITDPAWEYDIDKEELSVSWEVPADDDDTYISYANGPVNERFIPFIPDTNEMYVAALFTSNTYKSYKGYQIHSVSFVPAGDADFSFELLKDGEVIADGEISDYTIGIWNDIPLEEPVEFDPLADYEVRFNAYDCENGKGPFHMSMDTLVPDKGDLVSVDGEEWETVYNLNGQSYNWMIRMQIAEENAGKPMPIEGYDVVFDEETVNDSRIEENSYKFAASGKGSYPLRVDAYYPGLEKAVAGDNVVVVLTPGGVDGAEITNVEIRGGKGCICVKGDDVTAVEIIDMQGHIVARGNSATLRIDGIAAGVYVVEATVAGETSEIAKINVL